MKTGMKTLIAAAVVAVHALSVMAAMNPGDEGFQAGKPVAQASETEWQLPAVVVSASSMEEHRSRDGKYSAPCAEDCRPHCDERGQPSALRPTHHG